MTVGELLAKADSFELLEWQEYWKLEPFGDEWEMIAAICETVMVAAGRTEGADRNIWRPVKREKPPQSQEEMQGELAKIAAFFEAARAQSQSQSQSQDPPPGPESIVEPAAEASPVQPPETEKS